MSKIICKDCFYCESNHKSTVPPYRCLYKKIITDYTTGDGYYKTCKEINSNGRCTDYISMNLMVWSIIGLGVLGSLIIAVILNFVS